MSGSIGIRNQGIKKQRDSDSRTIRPCREEAEVGGLASQLCGKPGCIFRGRVAYWLGAQIVAVGCLVGILVPTYELQDLGQVA